MFGIDIACSAEATIATFFRCHVMRSCRSTGMYGFPLGEVCEATLNILRRQCIERNGAHPRDCDETFLLHPRLEGFRADFAALGLTSGNNPFAELTPLGQKFEFLIQWQTLSFIVATAEGLPPERAESILVAQFDQVFGPQPHEGFDRMKGRAVFATKAALAFAARSARQSPAILSSLVSGAVTGVTGTPNTPRPPR